MITDARVLRTGFVPREVEHRDAEVTHLTKVLAPLTDGDPADTTLLLGPSGVGKTCLANYTVKQIRQEVLDVESSTSTAGRTSRSSALSTAFSTASARPSTSTASPRPATNSTNASATTTASRAS